MTNWLYFYACEFSFFNIIKYVYLILDNPLIVSLAEYSIDANN